MYSITANVGGGLLQGGTLSINGNDPPTFSFDPVRLADGRTPEEAGLSLRFDSGNVVGVGGTTLTLDSTGNYGSETVWNNGPANVTGGGGGPSLFVARPSFQAQASNNAKRTTPDIALDADPGSGPGFVDTFSGSFTNQARE